MQKDVVCGVQVDESTATNRFAYQGETFYFCSQACEAQFRKRPEAYANSAARIRQHWSSVFSPPPPDSKPR